MKKILVLTDNFPPRVGGIGNVCFLFCRAFAPGRLHLVAPGDEGRTVWDRWTKDDIRRVDDAQPYPIHRIPYHGHTGNDVHTAYSLLSMAWHAIRTYRRQGCELVFFARAWPIVLLGFVFKALRIPFVVYSHGPADARYLRGAKGRLAAMALRRAACVMANSTYTRDFLVAHGVPAEQVVTLLPKVDLDRFVLDVDLDTFRRREGLNGKRVLLTVGRVFELKGQHKMLEAMPAILERHPDVVYVVVGEGPGLEALKAQAAEYGVEDQVLYPGNRDIPAFCHACDIAVVPSLRREDREESFGIVALEASACAKPVLAGATGGLPEAVIDGETGLLVDCKDVEVLTAAILRLLEDPVLCTRLGRQGRERVVAQFGAGRYAEDFDALVVGRLGQ